MGDKIPLNFYYYIPDNRTMSLDLSPLELTEIEIVGTMEEFVITTTATSPDILMPFETIREMYTENDVAFFADTVSFRVKDPLRLNEFKEEMKGFNLLETATAEDSYSGIALTVKDRNFISMASDLRRAIEYLEYIPHSIASSIYRPDGSRIEDGFGDDAPIFEVTEGFYETSEGKRLLNLAETMGYFYHTQPVTGTNETCLLMPFYNGDSYLIEGRDINEEEYDQGSKVCLAPRRFMEDNQLSLGDQITTRLFYTNTRWNAGRDFLLYGGGAVWKVIDEEGNKLEPFEISEYTVVGIYDTAGSGGADMFFTSGADELIVPMKSIASGKEKNLIWAGPMADSTTSFRIPNGTIEAFQKQWAKYGTPELEFTFYDMGYTQLMAGMENMRNMSLFFLVIGVILTALLLFFFSHLFITKQAGRTAIERSLGMSKAQCGWSILSGLMLLVVVGSIVGSVSGAVLSHHISSGQTQKAYYDTTYSLGLVQAEETLPARNKNIDTGNGNEGDIGLVWIACICATGIVLTGAGISVFKMHKSLSREPMELLSKMQRELS